MKNLSVKFTAIFICIALFLSFSFTVSATTYTTATFEEKLKEVQGLYPEGSKKYEWAVNGTVVGWQCHGYARWISFYVWGTDFANGSGKGWVRYDSTATTTHIDKLVPGDVLRYRTSATKNSNHSIFVTSIVGDTVYYTDCNSDGANTIKWNRSITKAKLAEHLKMQLADRTYVEYGYIAHFSDNTLSSNGTLTLNYNANGGTINLPTTTITKYTVVDPVGINMRSGAGTNYGKVGALPKGTVFTVTETKKDSAGKYLWGKTTYNSITGWCVISEDWTTKTVTTIPPDYALDANQNINLTKTNTAFSQNFLFGVEYEEGLANPATFGLEKESYRFLGWSTSPNGETVLKYNETFSPESVFGTQNDGQSYSATLYAVWESTRVLTGIEILSLPTKTKYFLNEAFDPSGIKIDLIYSDNTKIQLSEGFTLSEIDSSVAGEKTVTVTYADKTANFTIVIKNYTAGNINQDTEINLLDLILLAQYVAGWDVVCDEEELDLDGDGNISLTDVSLLSQFLAGWENVSLG